MLSDGRVAVFGGAINLLWGTLESCEALVLDIGDERWEPLLPMLEARADFACAAVGGCVIIAGGCNNSTRLASAEVYEEATGVWRQLPCKLPRALAGMGSALL